MTEHDPEFLRSIFLMEAWDTVATVEEGLPRLLEPAPTGEALAPLVVVAHRLKGAAGLHGFPVTAELAGFLETVLDRLPERDDGVRAHGLMLDLLAALKPVLDGIAATGGEDEAAGAAFVAAHPGAFVLGEAAGSPARRPAAGRAAPRDPGFLRRSCRRPRLLRARGGRASRDDHALAARPGAVRSRPAIRQIRTMRSSMRCSGRCTR